MRIFIGIPTDDTLKERLYTKQNEIKDFIANGKMTDYDHFHLTMLFIGEMNDQEIHILKDKLVLSLSHIKPFDLILNKLGSFNKGHSLILWIGSDNHNDLLEKLHQDIKQTVIQSHIPFQDTSFNPHITLARQVKIKDDYKLIDLSFEPYFMKVDCINIYLSSQINGKLTYTPLHTIHFK